MRNLSLGAVALTIATLMLPLSAHALELPTLARISHSLQQFPRSVTQLLDQTPLNTPRLPAPSLQDVQQGSLLRAGQAGPSVRELRELLMNLNYPVLPGETYDPYLAQQVGRFQQAYHLASPGDLHWGEVGPNTLQMLYKQQLWSQYNASLGQRLATHARNRISGGRSHCYDYVARAIHAHFNPFLNGMHAYMAADYLAKTPQFIEVTVAVAELDKLPAGAVVVWGKGTSRSGHISIADGQGNEISDHVGRQMVSHYGGASHRVFLPVARLQIDPSFRTAQN